MLEKKMALSIKEAAETLGVHPSTIRRLIADGTLPARRLRGRVLIPVAALLALFNGNEKNPPGVRQTQGGKGA